MPEQFTDYGNGTYHCNRCHRLVRCDDSDDPAERAVMLAGHAAFNCVTDPAAHPGWLKLEDR